MANCAKTTNSKESPFSGGLVGIFLCVFLAAATGGFAEEKQTKRSERNREPRNTAATVDDSLQNALKRIPWDVISSAAKTKMKPVITGHSIFRRLPVQTVYADLEIYHFLVEHPDVVVGFWEQFGITQVSVRELSEDRFLMKETGGTTAVAEVLYRSRNLCIVHAKGQYRGTLLGRPIDGEAVLLLHSRFFQDEDDEPYVVCQLDSFVRLDNIGADLVAKLLSNVLGKIADSNFEQTVGFVGNVSEAATYNTAKVKALSSQMKGVRKEVRDEFVAVVDRVAARGARESYLFPEYVELPILKKHVTEPVPFATYGIPRPILAKQAQPIHIDPRVMEISKSEEAPSTHFTVIPTTTATFVDIPVEPPQSRVIFRKPNIRE